MQSDSPQSFSLDRQPDPEEPVGDVPEGVVGSLGGEETPDPPDPPLSHPPVAVQDDPAGQAPDIAQHTEPAG